MMILSALLLLGGSAMELRRLLTQVERRKLVFQKRAAAAGRLFGLV